MIDLIWHLKENLSLLICSSSNTRLSTKQIGTKRIHRAHWANRNFRKSGSTSPVCVLTSKVEKVLTNNSSPCFFSRSLAFPVVFQSVITDYLILISSLKRQIPHPLLSPPTKTKKVQSYISCNYLVRIDWLGAEVLRVCLPICCVN